MGWGASAWGGSHYHLLVITECNYTSGLKMLFINLSRSQPLHTAPACSLFPTLLCIRIKESCVEPDHCATTFHGTKFESHMTWTFIHCLSKKACLSHTLIFRWTAAFAVALFQQPYAMSYLFPSRVAYIFGQDLYLCQKSQTITSVFSCTSQRLLMG